MQKTGGGFKYHLNWSYMYNVIIYVLQGITEDKIQEAITDLQLQIQSKDQQLQVLNSSTITLQDPKYTG